MLQSFNNILLSCVMLAFLLPGCSDRDIFKSKCDDDIHFRKVIFSNLVDSLRYYDKQYVEVSGVYRSGKEESGLFDDKLIYTHLRKRALWVNFSQDCPLYQMGTNRGLFEDDSYLKMKNKKLRMRGRIDLHNKGYQNQYGATLDHVSLIEL